MSAVKIEELARTFLVFEKACGAMYEMVMENHKRLNRLEKEFLALEKKAKN